MKFHLYKFLLLGLLGVFTVFTMDQPISTSITDLDKKLLTAINSNNATEVKLWLDNKANPDVRYGGPGVPFNATFKTPLIIAIEQKASPEIIKALLNAGANPNIADEMRNFPPIMWASRLGNEQAVRLLIDAGINHDHFFHYSLVYAMADGHAKIVKMLLNVGATSNPVLEEGMTLLMLPLAGDLANNNDQLIKMMKTLLANGININVQNNKGWTALMFAVQKNNAGMVKFLLENGANQALKNDEDKTVLDIARVQQNNQEVIELLQNPPVRKSLIRKKL